MCTNFYNLGLGDPYPISSIGKLGIGDMLDEVTALFRKMKMMLKMKDQG